MAVKAAPGEIVETTTRTRTLSEADEKNEGPRQDIWEVVETLKPVANLEKPDYEFTIYRGRKAQRADEKEWLGKFYEPMRREVIQQRFGGGEYNVWLKMGPGLQLRYNVDVKIGGEPINAVPKTPMMPIPGDATSQMLFMFREELRALRDELKQSRGGDLGLEAVKQALQLNGTVFSSAATAATGTLQRLAEGSGTHAPSPMDEMMKQFMTAAIAKMLNPSDPIESFTKMANAMGALGFKMGGAPGGEKLMDKLALGLVNQLPVLTQHVAGIMDGYRRAEEAKAQAAALARGMQPPITVQPIPPAAPAAQAPKSNVIAMPDLSGSRDAEAPAEQPAANGAATPEQVAQAEQMLQYIENKIVEILANVELTPEQAAVQALTFIDVTDPVKAHPNGKNLIDEILQYGEMGLNHIFTNRPILQQVPQGERLEAFKKAFLENGRRVPVPNSLAPDPQIPPA